MPDTVQPKWGRWTHDWAFGRSWTHPVNRLEPDTHNYLIWSPLLRRSARGLRFLISFTTSHFFTNSCKLFYVKRWKWYTWHRKASANNSSKLNKFLHSEVNLLIQHITVQDQDGQNNIINFFYQSSVLTFVKKFRIQKFRNQANCYSLFGILLTYSIAQQPLKGFDRPLMRVSLSDSIIVTLIFN